MYNSNTPLPGGYKLDSTTGKYHFQDNTNTNWFKEVFKTGIRQNHNVNLSGGGAHNTYNVSLDYYNQKGTLEGAGPNYERYTARVNNTMDTKFIKFHTSLSTLTPIKTTWGCQTLPNTFKVCMAT